MVIMRQGRRFTVVPLAKNTTSLEAALHSGVWRHWLDGVSAVTDVCAHLSKCDA